MSDFSNPSIFIDEILSYKENGLDFISLWDELNVPVLCPEIGCGGYIVNKKCSNNLTCSFNAPLCEKCSSPCVPTSNKYRCTSVECGFEYQKCNKKEIHMDLLRVMV